MRALDEAIQACGGTVAAFASAISTPELPVSQSKVSMWRTRRSVPAEYVPAIFRETNRRGTPVACERFQPRVDWDVLRLQSAPAAEEGAPQAQAGEHAAAFVERRTDVHSAHKWPTIFEERRGTDAESVLPTGMGDIPQGTRREGPSSRVHRER